MIAAHHLQPLLKACARYGLASLDIKDGPDGWHYVAVYGDDLLFNEPGGTSLAAARLNFCANVQAALGTAVTVSLFGTDISIT